MTLSSLSRGRCCPKTGAGPNKKLPAQTMPRRIVRNRWYVARYAGMGFFLFFKSLIEIAWLVICLRLFGLYLGWGIGWLYKSLRAFEGLRLFIYQCGIYSFLSFLGGSVTQVLPSLAIRASASSGPQEPGA